MWFQVHQALQQSLHRAIFMVATLLPGVMALVVALVVSAGIAWLFATVTRRILAAVDFDARAERWRFANVSEIVPAGTPSVLIARVVFWAVVLAGLFVGIAAFDAASAIGVSAYVLGYLSKIIAAAVLLLAGVIIARVLSVTVLINAVNMNLHYARLLSLGVKWLVLVFTAAMVLDHLGIARSIVDLGFGILFGGIVLALTLAIGLGSRDLVSRSLDREREKPVRDDEVVRHF